MYWDVLEVFRVCTNKFSQLFIFRRWKQPEQCVTCVDLLTFSSDTLNGEATRSERKLSNACSHWMDSRVTSNQPSVRVWSNWRFRTPVRKLEVQGKPRDYLCIKICFVFVCDFAGDLELWRLIISINGQFGQDNLVLKKKNQF